jgi:acetyl-CoA acetyltransferase
MSRAVVLSAVRTPVGRYGGGLAGVRPDDLAAVAVTAAVERFRGRSGGDRGRLPRLREPGGRGQPQRRRMAALLAGLPDSVRGVTVNRLCASGSPRSSAPATRIAAGDGDLFVAGGVESMSRAPLVTAKPDAAFPRGDRTCTTRRSAGASRTRRSRRCSRSSRWARPARTSPSAGGLARGPGRVRARSQQRWAAREAASRDELVPSASSSATSTRGRTRRREARRA